MATVSRERVRSALLTVVSDAGFDLEDVAVTAAGRRSVIRVVVDRDGGVDMDAVAAVSRVVSDALDASGVTGEAPYTLEVTSPGVDRPLTEPRHWRRAAGRLVTVSRSDGVTLTGRIVAADDESVRLDVAGAEEAVPLADLGPGRVQVEFDRPADSRGGAA
jgi:ribosome maturation factor RimP